MVLLITNSQHQPAGPKGFRLSSLVSLPYVDQFTKVDQYHEPEEANKGQPARERAMSSFTVSPVKSRQCPFADLYPPVMYYSIDRHCKFLGIVKGQIVHF